ncbi:MAG: hypothetical protein Q4E57_09965 [Eubacteriales bacterium]|nr:hypothetical protein [Eubacteriales bacterium]
MGETLGKLRDNKFIELGIKVLACAVILWFIITAIFADGLKPYYSYRDYNYQNDFSLEQATDLSAITEITQTFTAKGDILDNISVYLGEVRGETINVLIADESNKRLYEQALNTAECTADSWNKLGATGNFFERNKSYAITFTCVDGLGGLRLDSSEAPIVFDSCHDNSGAVYSGALAIGIQSTYRYLTLGSIFELCIKVLISLIIGLMLCLAVFNINKIIKSYKNEENISSFLYALYFAVSIILLYNPIDTIRTDITEFSRVIGGGLAANVDVSKRISNFNHWFIAFAVVFVLLYLLFNYWLNQKRSESAKKAVDFLNQFIVLADCCLVLRCITFFNDETASTAVYYFSSYVNMLIVLAVMAYVALKLYDNIEIDIFAKLMLIGASISYALAIFIALEWGAGRVLVGVMYIVTALIMFLCKFCGKVLIKANANRFVDAGAVVFPLVPVQTSFYIELIHILNRHSVFVAHPLQLYIFAFIFVVIAAVVTSFVLNKKNILLNNWKNLAYPCLLIGISSLSVQIPITSIYNPNLFESANAGILINDFLNYGTIPIVEHYGGHMLSGVCEGIVYGILNNDYSGAMVSPYSVPFAPNNPWFITYTPIATLLFYYLIKFVWNHELALCTALFFPFMHHWSFCGMGMLVCIVAYFYVKKNTYFRAAVLWAVFIWCALYRLDIGSAFGIALILTLIIYILAERNVTALKQLGVTLFTWTVLGVGTWFAICIAKGSSAIGRLAEFLSISLSNQNWAYEHIGNTANIVFAWSYIIIPFLCILSLVYSVFSKNMRVQVGNEKWVLLLIIGWAFVCNSPRALTRHSLAENGTECVIWTGYIFLALFFSFWKNEKRVFLPAFLAFIICNTILINNENFIFGEDTNAAGDYQVSKNNPWFPIQFMSVSIADGAVIQPASIIESWTPGRFSEEEGGDDYKTYWEQLADDGEVVERVTYTKEFNEYINKFKVLDTLLDEDETFVDFINKTAIYSVLGRRNPVYISQSPLQLSGEFTQQEFIKEIEGIPLVLMPIDGSDYLCSNSLDGITNAYRNYLVAEYIYQNYVPLCRHGSDYAIWCLNDRYDEYTAKLSPITGGTEYVNELLKINLYNQHNVEVKPEGNSVNVTFIGVDPILYDVHKIMDISQYVGKEVEIVVEYVTDTEGQLQLFYTTDQGEDYTGNKVVTNNIANSGTASFTVPITEFTRLRLDTPEGSTVKISSLIVKSPVNLIDYGYDGPDEQIDANGNVSYSYISNLHNHSIDQLSRIWAETDTKNSNNNAVICELEIQDGLFVFDNYSFVPGTNGNYLKITARYDGVDTGGLYDDDDETVPATFIVGNYQNGKFEEKCRYTMTVTEGSHDYLIRCSTDYYWYLGEINAVKIQCDSELHDVEMRVLEGD